MLEIVYLKTQSDLAFLLQFSDIHLNESPSPNPSFGPFLDLKEFFLIVSLRLIIN